MRRIQISLYRNLVIPLLKRMSASARNVVKIIVVRWRKMTGCSSSIVSDSLMRAARNISLLIFSTISLVAAVPANSHKQVEWDGTDDEKSFDLLIWQLIYITVLMSNIFFYFVISFIYKGLISWKVCQLSRNYPKRRNWEVQ